MIDKLISTESIDFRNPFLSYNIKTFCIAIINFNINQIIVAVFHVNMKYRTIVIKSILGNN